MRTRGFTLIELMIVVAIIGILAAIFIPMVNGPNGHIREACLNGVVYYETGYGSQKKLTPALAPDGKLLTCRR